LVYNDFSMIDRRLVSLRGERQDKNDNR
jgi:hypothetical protein